jgi:hypothetical protein
MADTYRVIGAGFAGLAAARALRDRGLRVVVYEARPSVGGNWYDGVYDSTHLITSRASTGFLEYPMPERLPDFPHRRDVLTYLRDYAETFALLPLIRFEHEVLRVVPDGPEDGSAGWLVTVRSPDGATLTEHVTGVVVANGHHWDPHTPPESAQFTGHQLHAKDYKGPDDLVGDRVLVVGAGNSGCDAVVEAGRIFGRADVSMRSTKYFMPKTVFGKPITDMNNPWLPTWAQRMVMGPVLKIVNGPYGRYGMPEPDHRLFSQATPINSEMLYAMRHGVVRYRPAIAGITGQTVRFTDGDTQEYDTILWATGYHISFPFLDHDLFRWVDGIPERVCGQLPENRAGLHVFGLIQLRGGAGPLLSRSAELLADLVETQSLTTTPISTLLAAHRPPDNRFFTSVAGMVREVARERKLVSRVRRTLGAGHPRPPEQRQSHHAPPTSARDIRENAS